MRSTPRPVPEPSAALTRPPRRTPSVAPAHRPREVVSETLQVAPPAGRWLAAPQNGPQRCVKATRHKVLQDDEAGILTWAFLEEAAGSFCTSWYPMKWGISSFPRFLELRDALFPSWEESSTVNRCNFYIFSERLNIFDDKSWKKSSKKFKKRDMCRKDIVMALNSHAPCVKRKKKLKLPDNSISFSLFEAFMFCGKKYGESQNYYCIPGANMPGAPGIQY